MAFADNKLHTTNLAAIILHHNYWLYIDNTG